MPDLWPPPCIHGNGTNLCADCQADYDGDPSAYIEFGNHPAGLENWKELQEQIASDAAEMPPCEPESAAQSIRDILEGTDEEKKQAAMDEVKSISWDYE